MVKAARKKRFIKGAIKKPGALRRTVRRRFGSRGFTKRGTLRVSTVRKLAKERGKTGQRARFALRLRKFSRKR